MFYLLYLVLVGFISSYTVLVGVFNHVEKICWSNRIIPQIGMNYKTYLSCHHLGIWGFPKMVVPNNHEVFLLKIIILGVEIGGTTI